MPPTTYQLPTTLSPPLVVIVGETASGKSALALELAKRFDGEIICADSWTVRREVNIGTAKPSADDLKRVPHHLLDIVDPCADFTAAVFKRLAEQQVKDITMRGRLPILAGGTGLYIDSVLYNYGFLPEGNREARQNLNVLNAEELQDLAVSRGLSLENVDVRNKRRLIRLLETEGQTPTKGEMRPSTLTIGLVVPREELRQRVTARVDNMLALGLEQEVKRLSEAYGWDCEALKGIGYREWREYLAGSQSLEQTRERIISATMNLAKRQRTWFKRNNSIQWISDPSKAVDIVTTFLNNLSK